jgi:hypothetical protein
MSWPSSPQAEPSDQNAERLLTARIVSPGILTELGSCCLEPFVVHIRCIRSGGDVSAPDNDRNARYMPGGNSMAGSRIASGA